MRSRRAALVAVVLLAHPHDELGRVAELIETGANDVLVVRGARERLIPFVAETVILDVDVGAGRIRVDWEWD